jgi:DNA modification methylase
MYEHKAIAIEFLIPYALNSRTHSDAQVAQLAASIREFGFTNPVLVDEQNNLIAGHGRVLAARKLGLSKVPAVIVTGLDDRKRRALIIADNKLALNAGWDEEALRVELEDLAGDFGELMGFSEDELAALLAEAAVEEGLTDEDEVPEVPAQPVTVLGDVWLLGKHRVMCGDSTSVDAVDVLMAGKKADMVFTDPPYNIGYSGTMSRTTKGGVQVKHETACAQYDAIKNDRMSPEQFDDFMSDVLGNIAAYCAGGWYVSFGAQTLDQLLTPLRRAGMNWKSIIIWVKNQSTISGKDYKSRYEPIVYGRFNDDFHGERYNEEDVWEIQRTLKNDLHPTMKPVPLVEKAVENSSLPGHTVLDLFGGSGSTLIACEKTNRQARLMELDPKYVDVIIKRWQDFTGKAATLEATGQTFAELSSHRQNSDNLVENAVA